MKINYLSEINTPRGLTFFSAVLLVVSMMLSPFLLSISMWGFVAAALWHTAATLQQSGQLRDKSGMAAVWAVLGYSFRQFFRQPAALILTILLLVPALSFFWSINHEFWLERTRVRIPFFVLPWVFTNLPNLSKHQYRTVLYVLVWSVFLICIGVGINFLLNAEEILDNLGMGQPIPVPRNHIRFNLILATAILVGGWLWEQRYVWRYPWERKLLMAAVVLMFVFIHVLSVRSGIVTLYAALLFSVFRFVVRTRRWKAGLITLLIIIVTPVLAVLSIPSLQQRLTYMVWDWQQYQSNDGDDYSDSERWVSFAAGMQLWRESPWLGVGTGDVPMEIQRVVNERFPKYTLDPKLPHNQFIYILTGTGLIGLLLSMLAFLWPIVTGGHRHFYLFATFQIIILISFLVEYTIETSIGVAYYLFYLFWFGKMAEVERKTTFQKDY
ncbi:MAG: O-antigen ligase family protein [Saprospiraceae bacterium]|nr:O-antigen ligase family protein [Saprospiraceae bacterium]MCC6283494.1 O-antigen ligase family protein [Saprospiraceae bacterium]